jgi:hypothetical protein
LLLPGTNKIPYLGAHRGSPSRRQGGRRGRAPRLPGQQLPDLPAGIDMAAFPAARLHPFPGGAIRNFPCLTINAIHKLFIYL